MYSVQTLTIPLSAAVSSDYVSFGRGELVGLWCPTVTSADVLLRVSPDTTSANFVRVQNPRTVSGSGDLRLGAGVGSAYLNLHGLGLLGPFLKVETAINQAAERVFRIVLMNVRTG